MPGEGSDSGGLFRSEVVLKRGTEHPACVPLNLGLGLGAGEAPFSRHSRVSVARLVGWWAWLGLGRIDWDRGPGPLLLGSGGAYALGLCWGLPPGTF